MAKFFRRFVLVLVIAVCIKFVRIAHNALFDDGFDIVVRRSYWEQLQDRFLTASEAFSELKNLKQEDFDQFNFAYSTTFRKPYKGPMSPEDRAAVRAYYRMIIKLSSLTGKWEKMYLPPTLDNSTGWVANQQLSEFQVRTRLNVKRGDRVLELGCGKGRILWDFAKAIPGVHGVGLNMEPDAVAMAQKYAQRTGMETHLSFVVHDYNDFPWPFPDHSFDGVYSMQASSFVVDYTKFIGELKRVLKPGKFAHFLEGFTLPAYNAEDAEQNRTMYEAFVVSGTTHLHPVTNFYTALKTHDFSILRSGDPSVAGPEVMIEDVGGFMVSVGDTLQFLGTYGLVPRTVADAIQKLNQYRDSLYRVYHEKWATLHYEFWVRAPES